ncbi:RNA editing ligase [Angomonas deanei]|nr:RNA editing ligase [Angomonas deanei]|eukprot:EPY40852.1 RNA editing ligase [Angomonas deanei]
MWRLARRWCLRPSISLLVSQRRAFSSGAGGEDIFERYPSIENSTPKRIEALQSKGMALDEWIATEKVHGANFSLYSIAGQSNLQFAKRSGMLPRSEHFFGYHLLIPELTERMGRCRELLAQSLNEQPHVVVVNGELFGGKYDHPQVPTRRTTVLVDGKQRTAGAVQTDAFPQYSPDLHFYAFDMQYKIAPYAPTFTRLTYDAALRIFEQVPGLLYAKPILRGPLYKILAFNVDKFQTTIPAQLGLGNYPLQDNWAEGIVVRHARRGNHSLTRPTARRRPSSKSNRPPFRKSPPTPPTAPGQMCCSPSGITP